MRFALITFVIVLADQLSKQLVLRGFDLPYWLIDQQLGFQVSMNEGVAFSLPITGVLSVLLPVVLLGFLIWYYSRLAKKSWRHDLVFVLVVGGALGNLIDRFIHGAVIDFIKIFAWPTFNIADTAIVVGFFLLILFSFRYNGKDFHF